MDNVIKISYILVSKIYQILIAIPSKPSLKNNTDRAGLPASTGTNSAASGFNWDAIM